MPPWLFILAPTYPRKQKNNKRTIITTQGEIMAKTSYKLKSRINSVYSILIELQNLQLKLNDICERIKFQIEPVIEEIQYSKKPNKHKSK
jgi:hypothetical protein